MDDHPEDKSTIERIALGRSRNMLDFAYRVFLETEVNLNGTHQVTLDEIVEPETSKLE